MAVGLLILNNLKVTECRELYLFCYFRQPVKKSRKKKQTSERPQKPKREPKPKPKVWRRPKNPRKKLKQDGEESGDRGRALCPVAGGGVEEEEVGLTDTQVMLKELEKIPYFRDPAFKSSFHMERSTFQVGSHSFQLWSACNGS